MLSFCLERVQQWSSEWVSEWRWWEQKETKRIFLYYGGFVKITNMNAYTSAQPYGFCAKVSKMQTSYSPLFAFLKAWSSVWQAESRGKGRRLGHCILRVPTPHLALLARCLEPSQTQQNSKKIGKYRHSEGSQHKWVISEDWKNIIFFGLDNITLKHPFVMLWQQLQSVKFATIYNFCYWFLMDSWKITSFVNALTALT